MDECTGCGESFPSTELNADNLNDDWLSTVLLCDECLDAAEKNGTLLSSVPAKE